MGELNQGSNPHVGAIVWVTEKHKLQDAQKKTDKAITPGAVEAVHVSAHLGLPGSPQARQLCHIHIQLSLGQSCHRQKKSCFYAGRVALVVADSVWPCRLWPARLLCQGGEFSRQEYWSILANICCHTLLKHYISCCPSCQLPWIPGAARNPATQAAAPPPHLALTEANSSPPGQPQEQTPVDNPHAEVEIKAQLKPRGSVTKEDPKPSHQRYKLQVNPYHQRGRLCAYGRYKRSLSAPARENTLVLIPVDIGGKNTEE